MKKFFLYTHSLLLFSFLVSAQVGTIHKSEGLYDGLTLIHPHGSTNTHLIDNDGVIVHEWPGDLPPGNAVYLLENGQLLRAQRLDDDNFTAGGRGGRLQLVEWDGSVSWTYDISSSVQKQHHDMEILPNGNILTIVWELITEEEAIANGRNPALLEDQLWPDKVIELKPLANNQAEVVWEWRAWDHLVQNFDESKLNYGVVSDQPGTIDLNKVSSSSPDWLHINSISYNADLDQILIGTPFLHEIWVIDHSTTKEEAATSSGGDSGKGGDLLYRWGNPEIYDRGSMTEQQLFGQHDPTWLEENGQWKVLLFNNGNTRAEGSFSTVEIIQLPLDDMGNYALEDSSPYAPTSPEWIYSAENKTDFFSSIVSGAQRLPNGNTLICSGRPGQIFEIDPNENKVWEYRSPVAATGEIFCPTDVEANPGIVFRAEKYSKDFSGLGSLENLGVWGEESCPLATHKPSLTQLNWDHRVGSLGISSPLLLTTVSVFDLNGKILKYAKPKVKEYSIDNRHFTPGVYIIRVELENGALNQIKYLVR